MARRPTTKLNLVPATLSPERTALAAEIERNAKRADEIAQLEADVAALTAERRKAENLKFALRQELSDIKENAAANALAAVRGGKRKTRTAKTIEAEISDVADEIAAIEEARDELEKQVAGLRGAAGNTWKIDQLRAAVIRGAPEVSALVAKVSALQAEIAEHVTALQFLDKRSAILPKPAVSEWRSGDPGDSPEVRAVIYRAMSPPTSWTALHAGANVWAATWDALQQDATAELPKL
jgi:chromosome segregation ATPase